MTLLIFNCAQVKQEYCKTIIRNALIDWLLGPLWLLHDNRDRLQVPRSHLQSLTVRRPVPFSSKGPCIPNSTTAAIWCAGNLRGHCGRTRTVSLDRFLHLGDQACTMRTADLTWALRHRTFVERC